MPIVDAPPPAPDTAPDRHQIVTMPRGMAHISDCLAALGWRPGGDE